MEPEYLSIDTPNSGIKKVVINKKGTIIHPCGLIKSGKIALISKKENVGINKG